jgi:IS5 family transposase
MAKTNVNLPALDDNLFLPVPVVMLAELVSETAELGLAYPEILRSIEEDQDRLGLAKKQLRAECADWRLRQTPALPGMDGEPPSPLVVSPLSGGRPRMSAEAVLAFLIVSHHFQSVYTQEGAERLVDSLTIHNYLTDAGLSLPGARTIGDNVNALSEETLGLILRCQLQLVQAEGLDTFETLCGDSTACKANAEHPTDSRLILRFLERAAKVGGKLSRFGIPDFREFRVPQWLKELHNLDFRINMAKNAKERKKLYRKYLKTSAKLAGRLWEEAKRAVQAEGPADPNPILLARRHRCWNGIVDDLANACHIHERCVKRVLDGKKPKGTHRVLSVADETAAWIAKGNRIAVIGYKPQLARSGNGFVAALLVPEGNAADSAMLLPLVHEAMDNTGIKLRLASFDDGYTSAPNRAALKDLEVEEISFSGSKARKLLGEEAYADPVLAKARADRSAVESLMFCLKHVHGFGRLRRRGIAAVRAELTGKVIIYNMRRAIMLRKAKPEPECQSDPVAA